jgi:multiple sugar transport system permease protein
VSAGPRSEARAGLWMTLPAAVGLAAFVGVPFALAFALALTDLRLGSPLAPRFVGAANFLGVLADPVFLRALLNNALFAAVVVPVQTGLALALALALDRPLAGMPLFRALFFLPVIFPFVVVAVVWELILAPGPGGPLNALLTLATLGGWQAADFLRDTRLALPSLMLLSVWQGVGFQMVILLAGLQGIPRSLYEAARVDGAGPLARFRHVTLPGLRNTLIFVVTVTAILAFRLFDQVRILTQGGPRDATTTVMYEAVSAAFDRNRVAEGSAMTVVFFVIVLALTAAGRRAVRHAGGR